MTNRLAVGAARLASRLAGHASTEVTISIGGKALTWDATVGETRFEYEDTSNNVVTWDSVDFIGTAAELVLGGVTRMPERGWQITYNGERFEVFSPGNERHYRMDPQRKLIRIHTKRIA